MTPYIILSKSRFIDALFESVSGFTTTGLTIFTDVESLPRSLLLWRAETQWIGGLGIIILFLVIVAAMRHQDSLKESTTKARAIANLYQAQGASEKLEASMQKSMRNTILIYGVYTLMGIVLLTLVGLTTFEATAISFTAISTAGFSVTNQFYTAWPVLLIVSFLMIAGAVSFVIHNRLFKGYFGELWSNRRFRFYIVSISVAVLLVFAFVRDFKVAFFNTLSAFTTTGFTIGNLSLLPVFAMMVLVFCMMMGGMLGSTAGGIKIDRIRLMLKSIPWLVKKAISPSEAIIPLKQDGKIVENESLIITQAFAFCYLLTIIIGTAIIIVTGESFLDSSFQTVSAIGGVGMQTTSIYLFHPVAKTVLIVAMLFGRLEIFPVMVLGKFLFDYARGKIRKRDEDTKLFYTPHSSSRSWKKRF
jgi:trk system potassium uptake protein TrkH